jgi:Ca2+-binding RTX toxin-like protein
MNPRFARRVHSASTRTRVEFLETRLLLHAGDRDPAFGLGGELVFNFGGYNASQDTIVNAANGRVFVGKTIGQADSGGAFTPQRIGLAVFDGAGNPVKSFSGDGFKTMGFSSEVTNRLVDLLVQPDNKVVVLVGSAGGQHVLARFNADGSLDSAFGQKTISLPGASDLTRTRAGDIVVAGADAAGKVALVRYGSGGTLKSRLTTNITGVVLDDAAQLDGRVVVYAVGTGGANLGTTTLARVKSDFTGMDPSFDGDGVTTFGTQPIVDTDVPNEIGYLGQLEIDSQGRTMFAVADSASQSSLHRLLASNGAVDGTFATSTAHLAVHDLAIAPSTGKISVSGDLPGVASYLYRFNSNGGVDAGYGENGSTASGGPGHGPGWTGYAHDVQSDGGIATVLGESGNLYRLAPNDVTPVGTIISDGHVLHITGTAGNDRVDIIDDSVAINGRSDTYSFSSIVVDTFAGNDRIDNQNVTGSLIGPGDGDVRRTIHAGAGNDYIEGSTNLDFIAGEHGNDVIHAGGGDDTIVDGPGSDLIDGGDGADTVDYSYRSAAVHVDLEGDADDGPDGEHDTVMPTIEHVIGTRANDDIIGDARPNFIDGRAGNDTIVGGGGNDTLIGGTGQDKLYGQDGDDFLDDRDGITDFVLDGGAGTDTARKDDSDPTISIEALFNG